MKKTFLSLHRKIVAYKTYFADFIQESFDKERGKVLCALNMFKMKEKVSNHYKIHAKEAV